MADVDEDQPINNNNFSQHDAADIDLSDEAQDFRFLSTVSRLDHATFPRRGEKDFEPHGTAYQASRLSASRDAMYQALSTVRIHNPRSQYVVGYWDATRAQCCVPQPRGPHFRNVGQADRSGHVWLLPEEALYLLERGNLDLRWAMPGLGHVDDDDDNDDDLASVPMSLQGAYATMIGHETTGKISLERWNVYANLKRTGYTVIRAPTWIHRSSEEGGEGMTMGHDDGNDNRSRGMIKGPHGPFAFLRRFFSNLLRSRSAACLASGPLTTPGLYRNYYDIYLKLVLIPSHNSAKTLSSSTSNATLPIKTTNLSSSEFIPIVDNVIASSSPLTTTTTTTTTPSYQIAFHAYKPQPTFKKSNPGRPDFRIVVINARESRTVPTLDQLSRLYDDLPDDLPLPPYAPSLLPLPLPFPPPPSPSSREHSSTLGNISGDPPNKYQGHHPLHGRHDGNHSRQGQSQGHIYRRLKHGQKNVILAVVDQGVISYLRFSDAVFDRERLFDRYHPSRTTTSTTTTTTTSGSGRGGKPGGGGAGGGRSLRGRSRGRGRGRR